MNKLIETKSISHTVENHYKINKHLVRNDALYVRVQGKRSNLPKGNTLNTGIIQQLKCESQKGFSSKTRA